MVKTNKKTAAKRSAKRELDQEYDGVYLLKLVLYVLLAGAPIPIHYHLLSLAQCDDRFSQFIHACRWL